MLDELSVLEAGGVEVDAGGVLGGVDEGEVVLDGLCMFGSFVVLDGDVLEGCCVVVSEGDDGVVVVDGDVLDGVVVVC